MPERLPGFAFCLNPVVLTQILPLPCPAREQRRAGYIETLAEIL